MTQDDALSILKTGLNVFLTGEPGSGKTHTINRYIAWLRERGVETSVTASTGIAATHVGGMTIHSWSGIGVKSDVSDWDIDMIMSREKTAKRIIDAKVLVIDEISMLDAATLASVDRVLRTIRRKPLTEGQPFGGLQVIFVGDFFQLPPVSKGAQSRFAFESDAWKAANPVVCYLSEQHRQEDSELLDLLSALRSGTFEDDHFEILRERIGKTSEGTVATRLYTHNADVDRINQQSLDAIDGSQREYAMVSRGSSALVETLKKNCLSPETLRLKEGATVMFTRNNFDRGYVNGTLGTVTGFTALGLPVVQTKNGEVIAEAERWEVMDGNKVLAAVTQVPLRLAWAITVHKSQGMSLDAATINLGQAFEYGQGYVAISRVRSLSGLYLEDINNRALMLHPKVIEKDKEFKRVADSASDTFKKMSADDRALLETNFLRAIGAKDPKEHKATVQKDKSALERLREKYPNAGRPWSKDDDAVLTTMFKKETSNFEIGEHFGRKPSAIHARLVHLGLVEDDWKTKQAKT